MDFGPEMLDGFTGSQQTAGGEAECLIRSRKTDQPRLGNGPGSQTGKSSGFTTRRAAMIGIQLADYLTSPYRVVRLDLRAYGNRVAVIVRRDP